MKVDLLALAASKSKSSVKFQDNMLLAPSFDLRHLEIFPYNLWVHAGTAYVHMRIFPIVKHHKTIHPISK